MTLSIDNIAIFLYACLTMLGDSGLWFERIYFCASVRPRIILCSRIFTIEHARERGNDVDFIIIAFYDIRSTMCSFVLPYFYYFF